MVPSVLCHTQSQYAPLTAIDSDGEGSTAETLVAWGARAAEDRQLTVRDVWGLMLHSVRGASLGPDSEHHQLAFDLDSGLNLPPNPAVCTLCLYHVYPAPSVIMCSPVLQHILSPSVSQVEVYGVRHLHVFNYPCTDVSRCTQRFCNHGQASALKWQRRCCARIPRPSACSRPTGPPCSRREHITRVPVPGQSADDGPNLSDAAAFSRAVVEHQAESSVTCSPCLTMHLPVLRVLCCAGVEAGRLQAEWGRQRRGGQGGSDTRPLLLHVSLLIPQPLPWIDQTRLRAGLTLALHTPQAVQEGRHAEAAANSLLTGMEVKRGMRITESKSRAIFSALFCNGWHL